MNKSYYGFANDLPRSDKRLEKYAAQFEERGFDDTETWSLDTVIARMLAPRLKRYLEVAPEVIVVDGDFREAIEDMIKGFEIAASSDYNDFDPEQVALVDKAYEQLAKWYRGLWW